MGCISSKPVKGTSGPLSGAGSTHDSRRPQFQSADSLSLAAAALAGVPPLTTADPSSSSSSSASASEVGYSSEDDDLACTGGTGTDQGDLAGIAQPNGLKNDAMAAADARPPLTSVKTTYKLQVGVLEGTIFLNQYVVVDTLGRGSFGKVKLCLNTGDDTLYAVKVVNTWALRAGAKSRLQSRTTLGQSKRRWDCGASASASANINAGGAPAGGLGSANTTATGTSGDGAGSQAGTTPSSPTSKLQREVEVMRSLDHPNLVRLYEVIEDGEGGKVLMVMEYCEAGALVSPGAITPDRHLPEAMAQFYFRQMAAGLAYLHQNHVVHGDVKPENVMLSGTGIVKIGDFGQSQFFGRRDTFNRTLGTPAYLAPEVCAGESYRGRQADVWALGVSLYLFIYGDMPFKGDSLLELYDAVVDQEVPYPHSKPISHELQDLFLHLLQKDPRYRATAAEVMQHPWVSGSTWQVVLPDLSCSPESHGVQQQQLTESATRAAATFNAEEVAAVVFPDMQAELGLAGGSPRSPSNRTHLVDALVAATMAAGEDDMALRLAQSPRTRLHNLADDSMVKEVWGQQSTNAAQHSTLQLGEAGTEVEDEEGSSSQPSSQLASEQSAPIAWAQPQRGQQVRTAPMPAAAAAAAAAGFTTLAKGFSDGEDSIGVGGVLDEMVMSMDGLEQQQQQQHSGSTGSAKQLLPPSLFDMLDTGSDSIYRSRRAKSDEQPPDEQQGDAGGGSCRQQHASSLPADAGGLSRAGASKGANLFRRSLRHLSSYGVCTEGQDGPDQGLSHYSPAASRAGSRVSSGSKGLIARSLGTLRSIFAGTADYGSGVEETVLLPPAATGPRRRADGGLLVGGADVADAVGDPMAARLPLRVPPPRPTREQPIAINIFRPGERMSVASSSHQQQTCFYIEQGVVELRYEADVPVTLSSILAAAFRTNLFRRPASAPVTAPVAACNGRQRQPSAPYSSHQGGRCLGFQDAADSFVHGSHTDNLRPADSESTGRGQAAAAAAAELGCSSSLAAVVKQATLRAEALLSNAKAGSVDHLLVSERTTSEFLGGLALLDPRIFMGRWKATAVARTHVVVMHMTREGLELFLQQNPLAQVHLRASMAKARAEVVKLEALEKIAVAHQHQHQLMQKQRARRRRRSAAAAAAARKRREPAAAALPPRTPALVAAAHAAPSTAEAFQGAALEDAMLPAVAILPSAGEAAGEGMAETGAEAAADEAASNEHSHATPSSATTVSEGEDSEDDGLALALSGGISSSTLELFSMVSKLRQHIDLQLVQLIQQSGSQEYAVHPSAADTA